MFVFVTVTDVITTAIIFSAAASVQVVVVVSIEILSVKIHSFHEPVKQLYHMNVIQRSS